MSTVFNSLDLDSIVSYYNTKDANAYAVEDALMENFPDALPAYYAFLAARSAAATNNPATS